MVALDRGARKSRQDEELLDRPHLGRRHIPLRRDYPVSKRRHQTDARRTIKPGEARTAISAIEIADRRPCDFAILSINAACGRTHSLLEVGIFGDLRSALRRNLQIGNFVLPLGMKRVKAFEGFHALNQSLGVVEPIDTYDERSIAETLTTSRTKLDFTARRASR